MKKLLLFTVPLLMLFAGCSTSKVATSWNGNQQTPAHFNKILVVGLFDDNNRALRQQMEDQLAQQLRQEGYNVITSISLYGPKSFEKITEQQAVKQAKSQGIDGVITIGLIDKSKEKKYVRDYAYRPYGGWGHNPWHGWAYRPYYIPGFRGYYETNVNYMFETNLYDANNNRLFYSVQTKSLDPSNVYVLADDYSKSVVKDIRKKNILGS